MLLDILFAVVVLLVGGFGLALITAAVYGYIVGKGYDPMNATELLPIPEGYDIDDD